jgi:hypothetical protein
MNPASAPATSPSLPVAAALHSTRVTSPHAPHGRALFRLEHSASTDAAHRTLFRRYLGIDAEPLYEERTSFAEGELVAHTSHQPHLAELTRVEVRAGAVHYWLQRDGRVRTRRERLREPIVLLSTLPWMARAHWPRLERGETLRARFAVPKVLRSAAVTLRLRRPPGTAEAHVDATPTSPLLRWLFGTTTAVLSPDGTTWLGFVGVLEPRDRRANGRWQEHFGRYTWPHPVPLA